MERPCQRCYLEETNAYGISRACPKDRVLIVQDQVLISLQLKVLYIGWIRDKTWPSADSVAPEPDVVLLAEPTTIVLGR